MLDGLLIETVNSPFVPGSAPSVVAAIDTTAVSSSTIVTVPLSVVTFTDPGVVVTLAGRICRSTVSSGSTSESALVLMVIPTVSPVVAPVVKKTFCATNVS